VIKLACILLIKEYESLDRYWKLQDLMAEINCLVKLCA